MKYVFLLLFVLPLQVQSQPSTDPNKIFSLEEVDQPPLFPGCESNFSTCNNRQIVDFLIENLEPEVLKGLSAEESRLFVKIIIDKEGNVRRPMVQSKIDEIKTLVSQLLKELPTFKPATKNGKPVNVIFSIPVQLKNPPPSEKTNNLSTRAAIATTCSKAEDAANCTTNWLLRNFINSFYDLNIKTRGKQLKAEVHLDIDSSGKVTGVRVDGENKKLTKVISNWAGNLPDFIPAIEDGENIKSTYSFPMTWSSTK